MPPVGMVKNLFALTTVIFMMLSLQAARNVQTKAIKVFQLNGTARLVGTNLIRSGERLLDNTLPIGERRVSGNPSDRDIRSEIS